jgi:hypothetical protein
VADAARFVHQVRQDGPYVAELRKKYADKDWVKKGGAAGGLGIEATMEAWDDLHNAKKQNMCAAAAADEERDALVGRERAGGQAAGQQAGAEPAPAVGEANAEALGEAADADAAAAAASQGVAQEREAAQGGRLTYNTAHGLHVMFKYDYPTTATLMNTYNGMELQHTYKKGGTAAVDFLYALTPRVLAHKLIFAHLPAAYQEQYLKEASIGKVVKGSKLPWRDADCHARLEALARGCVAAGTARRPVPLGALRPRHRPDADAHLLRRRLRASGPHAEGVREAAAHRGQGQGQGRAPRRRRRRRGR